MSVISQQKLKAISDEFLLNSDSLFEDCMIGLKNLDRIIVDTTSGISDLARGYLLPIMYAYWERFFRVIFNEYLRCIEIAEIDLSDVHPEVVALRFRKQLKKYEDDNGIKNLHNIADKFVLDDMKKAATEFSLQLSQSLSFPQGIDWVSTESNVSTAVLKKACERLKVNFDGIISELENKNIHIYPRLKELIEARNSISHGDDFKVISQSSWDSHKVFVVELMNALQFTLFEHLESSHTILVNAE